MPTTDPTLTEAELAYLAGQTLGRLATVSADGAPQNNPVSFRYNAEHGTIDIGGLAMGNTRKFRNVQATGRAAFVVDDIASRSPWRVRGVEIRGDAEALVDQEPPGPHFSRELIRIHPRRVISWGLDPERPAMQSRSVGASSPG
jgi:pyridoxamine 5'-phosphate oxidase family protein